MKIAFCAALAAVITGVSTISAQAGPDRLAIMLGSHHINATQDFEEFNPGAFLIWEGAMLKNTLDLGFGAYRNSYGDASVAVTTALPIKRNEVFSLDLFGAIAVYPGEGDQFSHSAGDVVPIIGAQARYRNVFLQAIPAGGEGTDGVLSLGLSFDLNN